MALTAAAQEQLFAAMVQDLEAKTAPMPIILQPFTVLQLVGLVQLALRHPRLGPTSHECGLLFIESARAYFHDSPAVLEVLRRGDDPNEDLTR